MVLTKKNRPNPLQGAVARNANEKEFEQSEMLMSQDS